MDTWKRLLCGGSPPPLALSAVPRARPSPSVQLNPRDRIQPCRYRAGCRVATARSPRRLSRLLKNSRPPRARGETAQFAELTEIRRDGSGKHGLGIRYIPEDGTRAGRKSSSTTTSSCIYASNSTERHVAAPKTKIRPFGSSAWDRSRSCALRH
jgi:hypothetical protein